MRGLVLSLNDPPLFFRVLLLFVLVSLVAPGADARAQPSVEESASASLRLGPLSLDPRLAIRNVGIDTNVFNEADGPVQDFTATVGPELDSWIRLGRLQWAGTSSVVWNYYRDAASERSFDLGQNGRVGLDLQRVVPYARGSLVRSRQRPNLEIDARVRWETVEAATGVDLLLGASTTFALEYGEREFAFDDASLAGTSLAQALDRRETMTSARLRYVITPLTTMVANADVREDRFRYSIDRNSNSARVTGGLELRPLALVAGRAVVGVRRFEPDSMQVPAFTGVVADVELAYQIRDLTRFVVLVQRDVDYSFEVAQAYYVSTGLRLSAIQALGSGWDIVGHVGRTGLDYRKRLDNADRNRRDRVLVYGLGTGRRLGTELRLGIELEYGTRTSSVSARSYEGLRGGGTFSYGF